VVIAELREVDAVFSTYRPDSHISRIGRGEIMIADCPAEVAEVIQLGQEAERQSGGAFSVNLLGADGAAGWTRAVWSRAGQWSGSPATYASSATPTSASPPEAT
jgi:hypothetical protein